jgi:hypothetical protein
MPVESHFLAPDASLRDLPIEELHRRLNIEIYTGHRADLSQFRGLNPVFDDIALRASTFDQAYEDQCTAKYYYDLFDALYGASGAINRIVEVGVFMGGASVILAGCAERMSAELDLVDVSEPFLRFSYERIRRTFPGQAPRVRLFHGDLPTYVSEVLLHDKDVKAMLQHDGAHDFPQVVRDLSSLYYVRSRIHGIAIQDTHLRGVPPHFNFVDAAVCAIFGFTCTFAPMGTRYDASDVVLTSPNRFQGNYFLPGRPEGMYLPMDQNEFEYPHPSIPLDAFLPKPTA